jgi:hypothetical protein
MSALNTSEIFATTHVQAWHNLQRRTFEKPLRFSKRDAVRAFSVTLNKAVASYDGDVDVALGRYIALHDEHVIACPLCSGQLN